MNKDKKGTKSVTAVEEVVEQVEEPKEEPRLPEYRTITITLDHYENIRGFYPIADIKTSCIYLARELGETNVLPIIDDPTLPIDVSFSFTVDINSTKEVDQLISSPAFLTVTQIAGSYDPSLYEQLKVNEEIKMAPSVKSFDSIVSIYEAISGQLVDVDVPKAKKGKGSKVNIADKKKAAPKKDKSKSKDSSATTSKTSGKGTKSDLSVVVPESAVYGMCAIDFIPLFYGKTTFTETYDINPLEWLCDEKMITYKSRPKITVTVNISDKFNFSSNPVIMNFTIESIYNIPTLMSSDMNYRICAMLPMENSPKEPMLFTNPVYKTEREEEPMKCWPGVPQIGIGANTTKYRINPDVTDIRHEVNSVLSDYIQPDNPRLQFNTLKRTLLLRDGINAFAAQIQTYRNLVLEIFMTPREKGAAAVQPPNETDFARGGKQKSDASTTKSVESAKKGKAQPFLHLMAIVPVSTLLYPGVSQVRVLSPVRTFSHEEAFKFGGNEDSLFKPKPKIEIKDDAKGKKDKGGQDKLDKGSKKDKGPPDTNLKSKLPPKPEPPPEPEPSEEVYNDEGNPCGIVIEIELSEPVNKKREVEDLQEDLDSLIKQQSSITNRPETVNKLVLTASVTKDYFREILGKITRDLNEKYLQFLEESVEENASLDFVTYLQKIGVYQEYLSSIGKATSLLITNKFKFDEGDKQNIKLYQKFIGETFVFLISQMNDSLNRLVCNGLEPATEIIPVSFDEYFFYAKEAQQLKKSAIADRYFLERLCNGNLDNPDYWFDYAVFNLEIDNEDRAFECVQEALNQKPTHRYSLIIYGAILDQRGKKDDAETCFLNITVQEPRWLEGWGILYLFYHKCDNFEGMDLALEMAKKYFDDKRKFTDYFMEYEDLIWTPDIVPKTIFFHTAMFCLKLRLYSWAELALSEEIHRHYGIVNYLLAAIYLYKGMEEHALQHIKETELHYGSDYAVCALAGHIYLALEKYEKANEEYHFVLELFNRPDDIHMVYVNCALVLEYLDKDQEARKLMLLACKYKPTSYTWFKAGQLYYEEVDLLSAEECLSEANFRDSRNGDIWGYLTLINLHLSRATEAELCYSQAIKNNVSPEVIQLIQDIHQR